MKRAACSVMVAAALAMGVARAACQEVAGVVLESETDRSIAFADVTVVDQNGETVASTVTDGAGKFLVHLRVAGTFMLYATRLGYYSAVSTPLEIGEGKRVNVTIRLPFNPVAVDSLSVSVRRPLSVLETEGFFRRMRSGLGTFITRMDILGLRGARDVPDVLRTVPGVRVYMDRFGKEHIQLHEHGSSWCAPTLIFDGTVVRPPWEELVDIENLEGMEVYVRSSEVPGRFTVTGSCGVVVAWSRPPDRGRR